MTTHLVNLGLGQIAVDVLDDDLSLVEQKVQELVIVLNVKLFLKEQVPFGFVENELVPLHAQLENIEFKVALGRMLVLLLNEKRKNLRKKFISS